jgi:sRNA-binding regulator protein Hfq
MEIPPARLVPRDSYRLMTKTLTARNRMKPPEQTFEEAKYLRKLIDSGVRVRIRLTDNEEVTGVIEFYDSRFIRLNRKDAPNLFIFKHDIKYLYEVG